MSAIAIVPSAPVLVPELGGAASAELADLSAAVLAAAAVLPPRWIAIGTGGADDVLGPDGPNSMGTFAGFGADLRVGLSSQAGASGRSPVDFPLCALLAGWVRGEAASMAAAAGRDLKITDSPGDFAGPGARAGDATAADDARSRASTPGPVGPT